MIIPLADGEVVPEPLRPLITLSLMIAVNAEASIPEISADAAVELRLLMTLFCIDADTQELVAENQPP